MLIWRIVCNSTVNTSTNCIYFSASTLLIRMAVWLSLRYLTRWTSSRSVQSPTMEGWGWMTTMNCDFCLESLGLIYKLCVRMFLTHVWVINISWICSYATKSLNHVYLSCIWKFTHIDFLNHNKPSRLRLGLHQLFFLWSVTFLTQSVSFFTSHSECQEKLLVLFLQSVSPLSLSRACCCFLHFTPR